MKWMAGTLAFLTVVIVLAVKFYLPNRFHHLVHKELLKNVTDEKLFKVVSMNAHQTLINSEKNAITMTSITEFNPLNYYVLVEVRNRAEPTKSITAKISYSLPEFKEVKINILFNDVQVPNFSMLKPQINLTTPLKEELISSEDLPFYLATHTKAAFSVEQLKVTLEVKGKPVIYDISEIAISIGTETTHGPTIVKIVSQNSAKVISIEGPAPRSEKISDIEQVLTFDSLRLTGIEALLKRPADPNAPPMPMMVKMMGLIPQIKSLITLPFKITFTSNATHESGKMPLNLDVTIRHLEIMQPDAFSAKMSFTVPQRILKEQITAMLTAHLLQVYGKDFKHPDFDQDKEAKFQDTFIEFLALANETNQTKSDLFLNKAVEAGYLKKEGELYSSEFVFENMTMALNGRTDFKEVLVQFIPKEEVETFLVSKGFVSTLAPQKNCFTILPGFPKANGAPSTKEACAVSCQEKQELCLINPKEKHLCYLNQCHWDEEVLTIKSKVSVPTDRAVLNKHLVEVKTRLKEALKRPVP